jgi:hypothetical protein
LGSSWRASAPALFSAAYGADGMGVAVLKGLLAGITVGIPLPVAGTAVGGGILALSGLNTGWRSPSEGPPPSSSRDGDS